MTRLADYIRPDPVVADDDLPSVATADPVEQVFDFPDRPQPSVQETVGRMVRVVAGEPTAEEMDAQWAAAEAGPAPEPNRVASAFDRGARLAQPKAPDEEVDPALKRGATPRSRKNPGGRPAGSDEFTDLFAAGMITLIAFTLGNEFQPTEDEAKDLARPIGNILARRIDLAKKLGQDANDVIAFAVALMAYGVRVGPIASDKVRESYRDRQQRTRLGRITEPSISRGTDGMDAGADVGTSPSNGPSHNPLASIAKARDISVGSLNRDFGYSPNGGLPMAADGSSS